MDTNTPGSSPVRRGRDSDIKVAIMRRFVARCVCGFVSAATRQQDKNGKKLPDYCCQCRRVLDVSNGWWLNLDSLPIPEPELDLLSVV